ncbi:glutamate ligase domain-containing protein [Escherichia coli]
MTGRLAMLTARWKNLPLPLVPQTECRNSAGGTDVPAGWKSVKNAIRDGIASAIFAGTFPDCERVATRYFFDVAHNPHAAEYLTGRMKALPKNGRVLAVIGMLHDKDIAGTLAPVEKAWLMTGIVRHWKGRAVPRQNNCLSIWVTANHFDSVAQAWDAAMADAKSGRHRAGVWFFPHGRTCHGSD